MVRVVVGLNRPGQSNDLTVGEAAARLAQSGLQVSPSQIRKLERQGLMLCTVRTHGNYRILTEDDVDRLRIIHGLRALGQSLPEIKKALRFLDRQNKGDRSEPVQRAMKELEQAADAQITRLQELKASLRRRQ